MKEEKFKVINYIRELVISVDKHLDNFPKKDIEIKNRVRNISYDILELAYRVNVSTNANKKLELIEEIVAKIKVTDFLINMCYDKQIINSKRYVKFGESLDNISKYLVGWKKSIEQRAQLLGLASPGVNANSDNANFGPGAVNNGNANSGNNNLFNSNGNWNANGYAVRPVVVLKSDIKESQLKVLEGVEEPEWGTVSYSPGQHLYDGNIANNP